MELSNFEVLLKRRRECIKVVRILAQCWLSLKLTDEFKKEFKKIADRQILYGYCSKIGNWTLLKFLAKLIIFLAF